MVHLNLTAEKLNKFAYRVFLPITGNYVEGVTLEDVMEKARQSWEELTGDSELEITWEVRNWKS